MQEQRLRNWLYIMGTIVVLNTPLSSPDIDALLVLPADSTVGTHKDGRQINPTTARSVISTVRPLLHADQDLRIGVVRLLHKSVFNFLTTPGRADGWFQINLVQHNSILAVRCLAYMNAHCNIYKIGDTSLLNSEVDDLSDKIHDCIPEVIRYFCRYFVHHFEESLSEDQRKPILDVLKHFMTKKLLYWIEVMGLLDELHIAETSMILRPDCGS